MRATQSWLVGCIVALGVAAPAVADVAQEYRNENHHFTVTLPVDWMVMTDQRLAEINRMAQQLPVGTKIQYATGFQPRQQFRPGFPYILVQIYNQKMQGLTYENLENNLSRELNKGVKQAGDALPNLVNSLALNEVALDRAKNRFVMRLEMSALNTKMQAVSTGYFGTEEIVGLHCYSLKDDFERDLTSFNRIADSFRFDPGFQFVPSEAKPLALPGLPALANIDWNSGMILGGMFGAVAGGILGVFLKLLSSSRRKNYPTY